MTTFLTMKISFLYHGAVDCGLHHAAVNLMAVAKYAGHEVVGYPCEGLTKRPFQGFEEGDLCFIMVPPLILEQDAYEYAGIAQNPFKKHIACWAWETSVAPASWGDAAVKYRISEVWTPTRFVQKAIETCGLPIKARHMPYYVPVPVGEPLPSGHGASRPYSFLYIFDFSSIFERKNPLALIRAYKQAFRGSEDVHLVIKFTRSFVDGNGMRQLTEAAVGCRCIVDLVDGYLDRRALLQMIADCDCYVSPHRAEGFGLTMAEAGLLGKLVIATGYSGNMDFMPPDYRFLIKHELVQIPSHVPAYGGYGCWAEPSVWHLAELMREAYEKRPSAHYLRWYMEQHLSNIDFHAQAFNEACKAIL